MTDAPIALAIHPGGGTPAPWRRQLIGDWLTANGIDPDTVSADEAITVLTVPFRPADATGEGPWLIQVIALTAYYVRPDGAKELNLITRKPVTVQRTIPLTAPFPTDPTTDGEDHGQAHQPAAQEPAQDEVRHARQEGVSDRHQSPGPQRPGQGGAARNQGAAEEGPGRGDQAVPEPEEDQPQEVGGQ